MKLTIDTEHKTIKIDEPLNLGALIAELSTMLGNDWNKYTLITKEVSQGSLFGVRSNNPLSGGVTTTTPYYQNNPIPFTYTQTSDLAETSNTIADGNR